MTFSNFANKSLLLYPLVLLAFGLGLFALLKEGGAFPGHRQLEARPATARPAMSPGLGVAASASLLANLRQNLQDPLTRLFAQLILILLASRLCGAVARQAGQPAVVGEMVAGILLGPSLLGWLAPGVFQFVFPRLSLGTPRMLSQIGVCLFMFVVGMELDTAHLRRRARTAFLVSQVSILFPYLLGVGAALFLYPRLAGPGASFLAFALFLGISLSITAFPVLARILEERGLMQTPLGGIAIACAATDDVTAWSVLALVVAVVKAGGVGASLLSLALVVLFVLAMLFIIRPRLPRWLAAATVDGSVPSRGLMAGVLVFIFACALITDVIGIHALFGAFLAGVVMPSRGSLREFLRVRLEQFSSVFLLPLFFAVTGLRTQVGLLNDTGGWLLCLGLILLATVGKLGGAMVAARLTGLTWVDSFALGALMNTRGLIELIALNIGYDLGILSPRIFAMLVLMALATTGLTSVFLNLADSLRARKALAASPV